MRIDSIPLFPTMIYKFNIDPKLYDKQNIIDIVEKNYQKSNYRNNFDSNSDLHHCLLYTSPSPRDRYGSRMPSSA